MLGSEKGCWGLRRGPGGQTKKFSLVRIFSFSFHHDLPKGGDGPRQPAGVLFSMGRSLA